MPAIIVQVIQSKIDRQQSLTKNCTMITTSLFKITTTNKLLNLQSYLNFGTGKAWAEQTTERLLLRGPIALARSIADGTLGALCPAGAEKLHPKCT